MDEFEINTQANYVPITWINKHVDYWNAKSRNMFNKWYIGQSFEPLKNTCQSVNHVIGILTIPIEDYPVAEFRDDRVVKIHERKKLDKLTKFVYFQKFEDFEKFCNTTDYYLNCERYEWFEDCYDNHKRNLCRNCDMHYNCHANMYQRTYMRLDYFTYKINKYLMSKSNSVSEIDFPIKDFTCSIYEVDECVDLQEYSKELTGKYLIKGDGYKIQTGDLYSLQIVNKDEYEKYREEIIEQQKRQSIKTDVKNLIDKLTTMNNEVQTSEFVSHCNKFLQDFQ